MTQGPADDAETTPPLELGEHLLHPEALHAHPRDSNNVGPLAAIPVDRLDVLVNDRHVVFGGRQRAQQRQASDGQIASFADEWQRVFHAPVRDLETRIDQNDVGH